MLMDPLVDLYWPLCIQESELLLHLFTRNQALWVHALPVSDGREGSHGFLAVSIT